MNAHIFASVAQAQTERLEQLSDEEFWDYARGLALAAPPVAAPNEYLECTLRQCQCLIPLTVLCEVVLPPHIFALLPALPLWMLGVVAWRGEAIACIDLAAYLCDSPASFSLQQGTLHEGILLVVRHADIALGLLVPAIGQTASLLREQGVPSIAHTGRFFPETNSSAPGAGGHKGPPPTSTPLPPLRETGSQADFKKPSYVSPSIALPSWYAPTRAGCIQRIQGEALVLDISPLVNDVVQQLEIAATYG